MRIGIDVPDGLYARYSTAIPWGRRSQLLRPLIEAIVRHAEKHGALATETALKTNPEEIAQYIRAYKE